MNHTTMTTKLLTTSMENLQDSRILIGISDHRQRVMLRFHSMPITTAEKELEAKRQLLKCWHRIAGEVKDMEEEDNGDVPRVQLQP